MRVSEEGGREGGGGGRGADTELKTKNPHVNVGKYRKHVLGFLAVFPQTNPVLPMKRLVCIFILVSETPECVGSIIKISWRLNPNPNSCRFNTHFLLVKSKFPAGELHFFHPDLSGAGTVAECTGSGSVAGIRWRCAVGGPVALSYILYMLYVCIMYMYTCIYIIYIYIYIYIPVVPHEAVAEVSKIGNL